MPIYEFQCKKYSERFELLRSIKDNDNDIQCPKCGKVSPKRLLSSFVDLLLTNQKLLTKGGQ